VTIKVLKECRVGLAAPKVHIGNLKVAPNCFDFDLFLTVHMVSGACNFDSIRGEGRTVAEVVVVTAVVGQEVHRVVLYDVFGVLSHEICPTRKGGRRG
jgi:hypothetical protein